MKIHRLWLVLCGIFLPSVAFAQQPSDLQRAFLEGLRERRYYDYAMFYLDQLEADKRTPEPLRQSVPFERAVTLLAGVGTAPSSEAQNKQLDQALALLQQFADANPQHPKAAQANSERGRILLGKARLAIWQARGASNQTNREKSQKAARDLASQAKTVCQTALSQHEAARKKFPASIDEKTQKDLYDQRREAEVAVMRAQIDLALCSYEEGQTYDRGSGSATGRLSQAASEFEAIYNEHRTQAGGLVARMWQGKCLEEGGDPQKALGIYSDLQTQAAGSNTLRSVQHQIVQFSMAALNHDGVKDYARVIEQAGEWLNKNRSAESRSPIGLGIRWEQAVAQEKLAEKSDQEKTDKERLLRAALANVRSVSQYPGEYRDVALSKVRDLMVKLHGSKAAEDPADFETAYELARDLVAKIQKQNEALTAAKKANQPSQEVKKLEEDRRLYLDEAARLLRLGLPLADADTADADLINARYVLSYVHCLLGDNYESAILGEFVAQHYHEGDNAGTALDCAYLALVAYGQAHAESPEALKAVDGAAMARVANLITTHWPKSEKANDARMQIGQVYRDRGQPLEAAKWFDQIPKASPRYAEAQGSLGQAYWMSYLDAVIRPDDARPPADELKKWQDAAQQHLRNSVVGTQEKIGEAGQTPPELVSAKVSLVQILLSKGQYQPAVDLLTKSPHSVLEAIAVPDGTKRPPGPNIRSTEFASLVYQLQLRAYVGMEKLTEARGAMNNLEKVASATGGGEAVTAIYVELGKQLQQELKRLKGAGDRQRLAEVRRSFENFLRDLFERPGQTLSSLVWIAETYYGLAEGTEDDQAEAAMYFDNAAASYAEILKRAKEDPKFIDRATLFAVKLRQVNCKRRQKDFEAAIEVAAELLQAKPNSLEAQIEAAYTLQEWGTSGQQDSVPRLRVAMLGGEIGKAKVACWGWGQIATNLQRLLSAEKAGDREKYQAKHYEARYNCVHCRHQYALAQSTAPQKKAELEKAKQELLAFVSISDNIAPQWWSRFDELYRTIQKEMGEPAVALEKPSAPVAAPPAVAGETRPQQAPQPVAATQPKAAPAPAKKQQASGGSGLGTVVIVILLLGAGGAIVFFLVKSQMGPRRVSHGATAPLELPPSLPTGRPVSAKGPSRAVPGGTEEAARRKPTGAQPTDPKSKDPKRGPSPP